MSPTLSHRTSIIEMFASLRRNRELIGQMIVREVAGRYRGSLMGLAWSFFNPLLMLAVYTFVFSVVFKARWGLGGDESKANFAIVLFVGLIVQNLFAECINRAPNLIVTNVNYVKKVIFPLEILPWVAVGTALFHASVSLLVLLIAQLLVNHYLAWTAALFPLILVPLLLATIGFSLFLSALAVYVRDVAQMTGIVTTILMFLAPVFYPISAVPTQYQGLLQLNPLTFIIEEGRRTLLFGGAPNWVGWGVALFASALIAAGGFWWFQKARRGFADVL